MDEQDFVRFLQENFNFRFGTGIGDDTSVVKTGDAYQLITKDILIENVHFRLDYYSLAEIALKSLAVNLSDLAAMGGAGEYFYLGLGCPERLTEKQIFAFFKGLKQGCERWNIELAGGDFSTSPGLFISITMVGRAKTPVYRHGAKENDLVGITGVTGASALGLQLLQKGIKRGPFAAAHKTAAPEIKKGLVLAKYVNAMIDVSDGLLIDLKRILTASKKGANIFYEKIPVANRLKRVCAQHGFDEYEAVLAGGEDYVLLFTISPQKELALRQDKEKIGYYIIGEITGRENEIRVTRDGSIINVKSLGYDHLKKSRSDNLSSPPEF